MKRSDLTEKLLDIKREKGWSWKHICEKIGGYSEVLIVGAILGQMKLTKPQAANAAELFGLSKSETAMLNEMPMRGEGIPMPPTDPLIYRFYELVMVNGPAWKALIEEEYGDGIMSAIDFDMVMERLPNPKGDRVKITMSGKFLPYKYYGSQRQRAGIWLQGGLTMPSLMRRKSHSRMGQAAIRNRDSGFVLGTSRNRRAFQIPAFTWTMLLPSALSSWRGVRLRRARCLWRQDRLRPCGSRRHLRFRRIRRRSLPWHRRRPPRL